MASCIIIQHHTYFIVTRATSGSSIVDKWWWILPLLTGQALRSRYRQYQSMSEPTRQEHFTHAASSFPASPPPEKTWPSPGI